MGVGFELLGVDKRYCDAGSGRAALASVSFNVSAGELVAITGQSGSGKSTLLNIIGLLDTATAGTYRLDGQDVSALSANEVAVVRKRLIGFIFQSYHLIPHLQAIDNVALPLVHWGLSRKERHKIATQVLDRVGLRPYLGRLPSELSGGEKQRVAIARALVANPQLLLADEPTGALDTNTAADIVDLLSAINKELGVTVLIVTHDPITAARCAREFVMQHGKIVPVSGVSGRRSVA